MTGGVAGHGPKQNGVFRRMIQRKDPFQVTRMGTASVGSLVAWICLCGVVPKAAKCCPRSVAVVNWWNLVR